MLSQYCGSWMQKSESKNETKTANGDSGEAADMYKNKSGALTSLREEGSHSVRSPSVQAFGNGWDFGTRERQMTIRSIIFDYL
jgi:hypothetical protein